MLTIDQREETKAIPKYNILVVDDEEPMRNLVFALLTRLGHWCVKATDGVDALKRMRENHVDAVITDIKMSNMDGIELTMEISRQYPGLPVMVMTGFAEERTAEAALSAGAREFIQKPFSTEEFTVRFNKMIRESQRTRPMKDEEARDKEAKAEETEEEGVHDLLSELEVVIGLEVPKNGFNHPK